MLINNSFIIYWLFFFFLRKKQVYFGISFSFDPEGLVSKFCFEGNLQADFGPILQWFCRLLCLYKVCQASETA